MNDIIKEKIGFYKLFASFFMAMFLPLAGWLGVHIAEGLRFYRGFTLCSLFLAIILLLLIEINKLVNLL